ncbi:MAG: cryptochrome/photolyase family protein [Nocardioides sp.]|uniref:cryptochrome/photolyase family protein n=1 Tax=Nocardioides sp. TaxID=35761 RepID=UPI003EFF8B21
MVEILWLRRDLRVGEHPALTAAAERGPVLPVFVLDPVLWERVGPVRRAWLARTLLALDEELDGGLCVRVGDPAEVLPALVAEVGATRVHLTREFAPWGVARDHRVAVALREVGVEGRPAGSPYAVAPGTLLNGAGTPYKVFTPWSKLWLDHDWSPADSTPTSFEVAVAASHDRAREQLAAADAACTAGLPPAGTAAGLERWREFLDGPLDAYDTDRDLAAVDGTSRLSAYLRLGALHPLTLLRDLVGRHDEAARRFRTELGWRDFYADVLHHAPRSAWQDLRPTLAGLAYDEPDATFDAWREGRTGFPLVDAGMRQLLAEGWMHNRVRMVTASFLTKDLHVWWPHGARHFLEHLADGDVASNNHGWQWVAGTGTDASPYFRVFNPVTQGLRFDPDGEYVRRWVPELADLPGRAAHEPWKHGGAPGYPAPVVDHAEERVEALRRHKEASER